MDDLASSIYTYDYRAKIKTKSVKIYCEICGSDLRNHTILFELIEDWPEDGIPIYGRSKYQICKCLGCETVRFREVIQSSEDLDEEGGTVEIVKVYPQIVSEERHPVDISYFPGQIKLIYSQTIKAFNCGANILAAGGLRAIVEAICQNQGVKDNSLARKIGKLMELSFLTKSQAELLHEERYIGNRALHEIQDPKRSDLSDGLDIIEGMLNTIYALPEKAKRLKKSRTRS